MSVDRERLALQPISPLLNDFYQFTMTYSYWCAQIHDRAATFEMFFRKNPFQGEYAVFGGLGRVLDFVVNYRYTEAEIAYLQKSMPYADKGFFDYLRGLDFKMLQIRAPREGTIVFANEPIIIVSGPLGLCQLLETTLLVLVNYATLIATNACRFRVACSPALTSERSSLDHLPTVQAKINHILATKVMSEFGLRRAQGVNGGLAASEYAIYGGFNNTSNVLASALINMDPSGTMAHAFVLSVTDNLEDFLQKHSASLICSGKCSAIGLSFADFAALCRKWQKLLFSSLSSLSEIHHPPTAIKDARNVGATKLQCDENDVCSVMPQQQATAGQGAVEASGKPGVPAGTAGPVGSAGQAGRAETAVSADQLCPSGFPVFNSYRSNESELTAFAIYAYSHPDQFLALIDTYNTLCSGICNFFIVAAALQELGYQPLGIRVDSGDLSYLSKEVHRLFEEVAAPIDAYFASKPADLVRPVSSNKTPESVSISKCRVVVSNDITEAILISLTREKSTIDAYGIGTQLVTAATQPSLGGIYKLVDIDGVPRMKLTEDVTKATIPGKKKVFRLYVNDGTPFVDLITTENETVREGQTVTAIHPQNDLVRFMICPAKVCELHKPVLDYGKINYPHTILEDGSVQLNHPKAEDVRSYVLSQILTMRPDHLRYVNPTRYKVSVTEDVSARTKRVALETKTVVLFE